MLPAAARLRRRRDFATALRRGPGSRRAARPLLVASMARPAAPVDGAAGALGPARVGFAVSKAVGSAVVRNRVKRRLRALTAARLDQLPPGALLVLRATPASASASFAQLGADLDAAVGRLVRRRSS